MFDADAPGGGGVCFYAQIFRSFYGVADPYFRDCQQSEAVRIILGPIKEIGCNTWLA